MGICWSEPPPAPPASHAPPMQQQVTYVQYKYCKACGAMCNYNSELCQRCIGKIPSAPPYYAPQYTPQTYYGNPTQTYAYYPQYMVQQQPQQKISTAGAVVGGVVLGAIMEDMMDPM